MTRVESRTMRFFFFFSLFSFILRTDDDGWDLRRVTGPVLRWVPASDSTAATGVTSDEVRKGRTHGVG